MSDRQTYEALKKRVHDLERNMAALKETERRYRSLYENAQAGLAMVDGIVSQNNGFVKVDTAPGRGSTFHVFFPCHTGAAVNP